MSAKEHTSATPLVLWTQGGPGLSSLFGQFLEIGPLAINGDGNLYKRLRTIQKNVSVIYLDVPVGAGYSFTKDPSGYAHSLEDISAAVAEFLGQFLILFPEYKERDFYVAGESYGADSSEFLYRASMLTEEGRATFAKQFQTMRNLFASRRVKEALYLLLQTVFTDNTNPTLFQNLTLYNNQASALYSEKPANIIQYSHYVNTAAFREAIHVGLDVEFEPYSQIFMASLAPDMVTDISAQIELLLNSSQVLFYTGQVDTLLPSTNLRAFFRTLHWIGAWQYQNSPGVVWNVQDWF
ncbi:hypothetical protein HPB49_014607 [Dermacentor silvarum]|uniref:Uncharacterized protein n=1 Tax=Dermacentor silvarum TaxID=543639 RepID=A0ACB8DQ86_DERSI|nr:hypothetical protein HPB49_014607 [Dermacentor silvarum]